MEEAKKIVEKVKVEMAEHQTAIEQGYADVEYLKIWLEQKNELILRSLNQLKGFTACSPSAKTMLVDELGYLVDKLLRMKRVHVKEDASLYTPLRSHSRNETRTLDHSRAHSRGASRELKFQPDFSHPLKPSGSTPKFDLVSARHTHQLNSPHTVELLHFRTEPGESISNLKAEGTASKIRKEPMLDNTSFSLGHQQNNYATYQPSISPRKFGSVSHKVEELQYQSIASPKES